MKITKVVATDLKNNEKQIFTFGEAADGKSVVTSRGGRLNHYFEFCFNQDVECTRDVEMEFCINSDEYSFSRLHNEDGTTRTLLKKMIDGHYQVVARSRAVEYIEEVIDEQLDKLRKLGFISNKAVENFHGDLKIFDEIRLLAEVQDSIARSSAEAKLLKDSALKRVKEYAAGAIAGSPATSKQLDALNGELDGVVRDLTVATAQLGELKAKQNVDAIRTDIANELESSQQKYNKLISRQDDVEKARQTVQLRDDLEMFVPKVKTLRNVGEQRAEYERKRYSITSELEWQENELQSIKQQLAEKDRQYAAQQDKRSRVEAINNELAYIASLYEKNKKLNETLLDLNDKEQRLTAEKAMYTNKLDQVEKSITEVRDSLDAFHIPARSVGELLEAVRIDVKIDEVTSQTEKLESEIAVKESQIAEKESNLVVQVKRFRAVAELDVAVTPIKAKDTILQVLDAKYSKLESINLSLKEKQRNLERAMEDYKYRILQLEQSRSRLEAEREKALLRKQEEFKREVLLNSQKVYSDDASSIFAVSANFHDQEIESLNQEIVARNLDRDLLMERAYQLEGSIKEIKRHIEINSAEMETLQREKDNINKRYNEIVSQNSSEVVFNYLKALNSDNGTKYLLDVQQDAVRSEAELAELKRSTEAARAKLSALKSRLKYLRDTQQQLDDTRASVDTLVTTNDKLKDELTDIGGRLSAGYEQYKAVTRQLESIESKLDDVHGAIMEASKTIKVNEDQIAAATQKAQTYAGGEDIEQAIANLRYELGDVESERNMLIESKQTLEKEIFKKRLELEKTDWLYESKSRDYNELYQELRFEFNLKGWDIDKISTMDLDTNVDGLRKLITEFDTMRKSLAEKIDNLYTILKNQPAPVVSQKEIEAKEQEIALLQTRQQELEQQRNVQFSSYVAANAARTKVSVAAAEARTLSNLRETLVHNEIISLLISDKIKTMLEMATRFVNAFSETNGNYKLVEENFTLKVILNGETIAYDDLPQNIKTAVYTSIILSIPNTDMSDGKWLIFDERINIDKKLLSDMLLSIDDVSYVVGYDRETMPAPQEKAEDKEEKTEDKQEEKPEDKPEEKTEEQPQEPVEVEETPEQQPEEQSAEQPEVKSEEVTQETTEENTEVKAEETPEEKLEQQETATEEQPREPVVETAVETKPKRKRTSKPKEKPVEEVPADEVKEVAASEAKSDEE